MDLGSILKSGSKQDKLRDSMKDQVLLEKDILSAKERTPTKSYANAEMFKSMGNAIREPGHGAQRAFSGLMHGLEGGAKASSMFERQEDLEKFNKVMDYLSATNQELVRRNKESDRAQDVKKRMVPEVGAYLQTAQQMSPQARELSVRGLIDQYNREMGDNIGFVSVDGKNPYLVTLIKDNESQSMDIRYLFADEEMGQKDISLTLPHIHLQEEEKERHQKAMRQHWENQDKAAQQNIAQRDRFGDPLNKFNQASATTAGKEQQKEMPKLQATIEKSDKHLRNIEQIEKLIEGNEDIFQSQLANLWMMEDPSMLGTAMQKVAKGLAPEKSKVITLLNKYLQEMVLDKAALFQRPNQFIEKVGSKAVPNYQMTAEAFKDALAHIKEEIIHSRDTAQQRYHKYASNMGELGNVWQQEGQGQDTTPSIQGGNSAQPSSGIRVKDPTTGEEAILSPEHAMIAIQKGGVLV